MARMIDADKLITSMAWHDQQGMISTIDDVLDIIEAFPTLSSDLISRSALLMGETQPEITTGSDSELAEHMEWDRWMDKVKRAPAVGKEATL